MANRFRQYGAWLLFVQGVTACSPPDAAENAAIATANGVAPAAPAAEARADAKLVMAFGDSLFAGYNLGQTEGFAPALERGLRERGVAARVFNAAVSGDTSAGGRQRLAFALEGLPRKPDLVIVELGANDMLRGLDPAQTRANLDAILADLDKRGIPVILAGMVAAPNMGADYARAFNAIYPDLAKKYDAPLYPFVLEGVIGRRDLLLGDGIHPNPKGVDVMVDGIAPLVARDLKDRAGSS